MEAFNAAVLTPISVLCEKRREPKRVLSFPAASLVKFSNSASLSPNQANIQDCLSKTYNGCMLLLSSVLVAGPAKANEEALQQTVGASASDFDASRILDGVVNFASENPTVIAGGAAALAVTLVLSQVLKGPKPWGVESARKAYAVLGEDANTQLLDIRAPVEFREVGSPDIKGLNKKPVSIVYKGEDKPGFLKKLSLKFKEPDKTTLFILDKYDGNSERVAELVTVNGFKAAYAIKDGAEGPKGWMNSGQPWLPPKKSFSFDLSDFKDSISDAFGGGADALPVTFGIAAAAGLGVLAFSEVEAILQLLGSVAILQLASNKLLFAEDRKKTLQQVDEFLNTKIAPEELVDEIKEIGKALLPSTVNSKALPAPAEAVSEPAAADTIQKVESSAVSPTSQINSVSKVEVKAETVPKLSRPLSPYPSYPDLKPPSSPTPSQP